MDDIVENIETFRLLVSCGIEGEFNNTYIPGLCSAVVASLRLMSEEHCGGVALDRWGISKNVITSSELMNTGGISWCYAKNALKYANPSAGDGELNGMWREWAYATLDIICTELYLAAEN